MRAVLLFREDLANAKETKGLIYFAFDNRIGDEIPSGITNLVKGEISLIGLLNNQICHPYLKPLSRNFVKINIKILLINT